MFPVHRHNPRFLGRMAVTDRCAGAPAPPIALRWTGARGGRRRAALAFVALLAAGCADARASGEDVADRALRLEASASSLDELGAGVLEALTDGDLEVLEGFRLTERQHDDVVWPELPASRPEVNFPVDFAWQNIEGRNVRGLKRIAPVYAGRALDFQRVECRGEPQTFATFDVLTDCWVVFVREDGEAWEAQLFKDVLVRGGGHKVFRYYDDDPRRSAGARGR